MPIEPTLGSYACVWIPRVRYSFRLFGHQFAFDSPNLFGWVIRIFTWSRYCHAFIYIGGGKIVEAQPRGARIGELSEYAGMPAVWSQDALSAGEAARVVGYALSMVGTPYGFLDLVAIGLARLGLPYGWVLRRALDTRTAICSQLVAMAGNQARYGLWMCGQKYAQLVTPGLLAKRLLAALRFPKVPRKV